ncbi:MAG: S9 family peptidase [Hellea sp.]|nr:S9 family peptidase [Hellea sp.]
MPHKFFSDAKPPIAPKMPETFTQLGRSRVDEYAWMKDEDWQTVMREPATLRADIRSHLEAENLYTQTVLEPLGPLKDEIFEEMKGRLEAEDSSVPAPDGDYAYYHRYRKGDQHGVFARKSITNGDIDTGGEESIILDADLLAKDHKGFFNLGAVAQSRDHNRLAYSMDTKGSENFEIFIKDLLSGKAQSTDITTSTGGVVWAADNQTIFWVERDDNQRPYAVFSRNIDRSDAPRLVYKEEDPGFFVSVSESDSRAFIEISAHNHTTSEIWLIPASAPHNDAKCFAPRENGREYSLHEQGGYFYILTNADGAVDFQIMRRKIDAEADAAWESYIPYKPGTLILGLEAFEDHLVYLVRENALPRIVIVNMESGEPHDIDFDEAAFGLGLKGDQPYESRYMRFVYSSPTTPAQIFDYHMDSRERILRKTQKVPSGHKPEDYKTERLMIKARDGETIPVTLLYKSDLDISKKAPCLLYGYGSYGITISAGFRTGILSLVDRGFIYAFAHIRGGMAKGYRWYLDGKLEKKPNTFNDYVDVGRGLCDLGYTEEGRLVAHGGSAGGLLVGAALNQDPKLFGAVIAAVPFVDVLNTMSDTSLPLTPPEWPEWGNPLEDERAYDLIKSYSPYDNIVDAAYPPLFITGGLTDPRVTYWEPAKWAARLRDHQTGDEPILLKINMEAGHQGESGRYDSLKETALEYAFAVTAMAAR